MRIEIETIPHSQQRYSTPGDWFYDENGVIHIKVSELSDWRREALMAIHELAEMLMCKHDGVTQESVDRFDIEYERNRTDGDESEPGDDLDAPYRKQHCIASGIERVMAGALEVCWDTYGDEISRLR